MELRNQIEEALNSLGLCYLALGGDSFKVLDVDFQEKWPIAYFIRAKDDFFEVRARLLRIPAVKGEEERAEMLRHVRHLNENGLWGECILDEEGRVWLCNQSIRGSFAVEEEVKVQIHSTRMVLMLYSRILCPEMDKERCGNWDRPLWPFGKIRRSYRLKPAYRFIPFWRHED